MASGLKTSSDAQPQVLFSGRLPASIAAQYTCPASTSVKLMNASVCNTTGAAITVYVALVQTGQTIGDGTHFIVSGYNLAANDTLPLNDLLGDHVLGPGDAIAAYCSAGNSVDFVVSGVVFA